MALPLALLPGDRRQACEARRLLSIQGSELRHLNRIAKAVASAIPGMLTRMASFCDSTASHLNASAMAVSSSRRWASICLSRAAACR